MKVNIRKQRVGVKDNKEMYVAHIDNYSRLDREEMLESAARNTGMSRSMLAAALSALEHEVTQRMLSGHIVDLGELGTFRVSFNCKAVENREDLSADCITRRRVIFHPSKYLKRQLGYLKFAGFAPGADDE